MANNNSTDDVSTNKRTPFGKEMLKHFLFDSNFKNFNHGNNFRAAYFRDMS